LLSYVDEQNIVRKKKKKDSKISSVENNNSDNKNSDSVEHYYCYPSLYLSGIHLAGFLDAIQYDSSDKIKILCLKILSNLFFQGKCDSKTVAIKKRLKIKEMKDTLCSLNVIEIVMKILERETEKITDKFNVDQSSTLKQKEIRGSKEIHLLPSLSRMLLGKRASSELHLSSVHSPPLHGKSFSNQTPSGSVSPISSLLPSPSTAPLYPPTSLSPCNTSASSTGSDTSLLAIPSITSFTSPLSSQPLINYSYPLCTAIFCFLSNLLYEHSDSVISFIQIDGISKILTLLSSKFIMKCTWTGIFSIIACLCICVPFIFSSSHILEINKILFRLFGSILILMKEEEIDIEKSSKRWLQQDVILFRNNIYFHQKKDYDVVGVFDNKNLSTENLEYSIPSATLHLVQKIIVNLNLKIEKDLKD
jgi:hypothetical protein